MTEVSPTLAQIEQRSARAIDAIAKRPRLAAAVLIAIALLCYLPGLLALPPVDRTDVIYAESSRAMLERGDLLDARFLEQQFAFRPIGVYWLQIASGKLLGPGAWDAISTYRFPSLLGGLLAVLAVWWLLRPLLGPRGSVIAAAFYAVTPIVALQAQLAIPEGPLLLAAAVAQLSLLRIYYCAAEGERHTGLAIFILGCAGLRHPAQCARGADTVAIHDHCALHLRQEGRLAQTAASAHGRAGDDCDCCALDFGPRTFRRRRTL
ncbi:MAG: ArnT family glycosyltransferase [Hyphomicrobium sp.]